MVGPESSTKILFFVSKLLIYQGEGYCEMQRPIYISNKYKIGRIFKDLVDDSNRLIINILMRSH